MRRRILLSPIDDLEYYRRVMSIRPGSQIIWKLSDLVGRVSTEITGKKAAALDLLDNGGFETAGGGGADIWAYTQESLGDGVLADELVIVHAGGSVHAAKITSGVTANTFIRPTTIVGAVNVIPETPLILKFWTRGDGVNAGRFNIYDSTNAVWIRTTIGTGIPGIIYSEIAFSFTVPPGCFQISIAFFGPPVNGGICYYDDATLIGNIHYHGMYAIAGMTYGVTGIGDGSVAARFSGADTGLQVGSKAFSQFWNGNKGTVMAWGKVDGAGRWTDAASYRYTFHAKSRQDATVYIVIGKNTTNHQIVWRRRCAVAMFEKTFTFAPSGPTTWFCQSFSWDRNAAPQKYVGYIYAPGHTVWQKVFDEAPAIGNELWNNAIQTCDDANTVLAGGAITTQEWFGEEYLCVYWPGEQLTDEEIRRAMIL